ncbi:MAG: hypothetical protein M3N95_15810 [Actinomycetota bacterium]|nr:hypothetical protein [Actinomycetota bacterium]
MRARLAAHSLHARIHDETAHTAPARLAFLARFEREVDPGEKLPLEERRRRADHARKAYFTRLALASVKARRVSREPALANVSRQHPAGSPRGRLIAERYRD